MKALLTLLMVGIALWLLWGGLRRLRGGGEAPPRQAPAPQPAQMVACAHCGVHLPLADAVADGTHVYCGEPHRLAGPRAPTR